MKPDTLELNVILNTTADAGVAWDGYKRVRCDVLDDNHPTALLVAAALKEYWERRGRSVTVNVLRDRVGG